MDEGRPFLEDTDSDAQPYPTEKRMYKRQMKKPRHILQYSNFALLVTALLLWALILFISFRATVYGAYDRDHCEASAMQNASTNQSFFATHNGYLACGNNRAEAAALGCEYDILTNHWLPGQCVDPKSVADYQADGSWVPYADKDRTRKLKVEELGALDFYFTSMRDHINHCAMLWTRQYRAFSEGWKYVDSITAEAVHTHHCAKFLMDMADREEYRTEPIQVMVGKSGCHFQQE